MLEVLVNNQRIEYHKANCTKSIQTGVGSFEFVIGGISQTFQENTNVKINVNGTQVLNGKIEFITTRFNRKESYFLYAGRDNASTVIDSTFDKVIEFNRRLKILDLLTFVLEPYRVGITQDNEVAQFTAFELPTAEVGENVFSFCDKLCRIRQSILTSNNDGGLLITNRGQSQANDILKFGEENSNIVERETYRDVTKLYDKYTVYSQNNSTLDDLNNLVNTSASIGNGIRTKGIVENNSLDVQECQQRATFEQELDRRRAFRYKATLSGHAQTNNTIWNKNLQVSLIDSAINVNRIMLVNTVEWRQSENDISTCLTLEDL